MTVTFKCGHKGTAKGREKYYARNSLCRDCYRNQPVAQTDKDAEREQMEAASEMSEIHVH